MVFTTGESRPKWYGRACYEQGCQDRKRRYSQIFHVFSLSFDTERNLWPTRGQLVCARGWGVRWVGRPVGCRLALLGGWRRPCDFAAREASWCESDGPI